jgi:hypothetical protein|tara:strand:- start:341 stop:538 length:198 start_codon:yes stop_codon:yes gene_type:complete
MKVGKIYIVNTDRSHITSHKGDVVVVESIHKGTRSLHTIRAFNLKRRAFHDYFVGQLNEVKNESR